MYEAPRSPLPPVQRPLASVSNVCTSQMRFQALMPDILHWLGIKKIDRMLSMSNMKHDAIVESGIKILERIPIPEEMIPSDSRVEIDAKINAGYFTTGKQYTMEELTQVRGRGWEKWEDITVGTSRFFA